MLVVWGAGDASISGCRGPGGSVAREETPVTSIRWWNGGKGASVLATGGFG